MDTSFRLGLILSAVNNTGAAFGAVLRNSDTLQSRQDKFKNATQDLFNIGSAASIGAFGVFAKMGMDLQDTKTRFEVFLKDGNKAKEMLKELNTFADISPFSNEQVYGAATALLPYIKDTTEMKTQLGMLGDIASGLKLPFEDLARIYGKFKGGNIIQGEELEMLRDRGFKMEYLAKALGVTEDKIKKLGSDGKIHFSHIQKAFELATQEGGDFHKMTETMAGTASGKLSTALGQAKYQLASMAETSLPILTASLDNIIPMLDKFGHFVENNQELVGSFVQAAMGFTAMNIGFKGLNWLYQGGALMVSNVSNIVVGVRNFTSALQALKAAQAIGDMGGWYRALEQYGTAGNWAARSLGLTTASQLGLNTAMLANPYVLAVAGLVALGGAIWYANKEMTKLSDKEQAELDLANQVKGNIRQEHTEFTKLWMQLEKTNPESKERLELAKKMTSLFPNYTRGLDLEKAKLSELPKYYDMVTEKMMKYAMQKHLINAMDKELTGISDAKLEAFNARNELKATGGNIADWIVKNNPMGGLRALVYGFSQTAKVEEAMNNEQQHHKKLKGLKEYGAELDKELNTGNSYDKIQKELYKQQNNTKVENKVHVYVGGNEVNAVVKEEQRKVQRTAIKTPKQ